MTSLKALIHRFTRLLTSTHHDFEPNRQLSRRDMGAYLQVRLHRRWGDREVALCLFKIHSRGFAPIQESVASYQWSARRCCSRSGHMHGLLGHRHPALLASSLLLGWYVTHTLCSSNHKLTSNAVQTEMLISPENTSKKNSPPSSSPPILTSSA